MNKLLTKIVGVALGATMAVGVGVAAVKASDGGMQRAEAVVTTKSVTLSSGQFSTDHITWNLDGAVTIQQLKGSSSTAVNSSYISAPRVYKGHVLSFVATGTNKIKSISITVNSTYYGNSMTAGTVFSDNVVTDNTTDVARSWTTSSGGTHTISSVSDNGLSAIYIQNVASESNVQLRFSAMTITYDNGQSQQDPTLSVSPTFAAVEKNGSAQLTATPQYGTGNVSWVSSDDSIASLSSTTGNQITVTGGNKRGSATVTASYSTATPINVTFKVTDPQHAGTEADPYTAEDAIDKIDLNNGGLTDVYATGIVSRITTAYSEQHNNVSFDISTDGLTTSEQLRGYRTVGTTEYPINSADSVQVGDTVVLRGNLTKFNSTYELDAGNELVYLSRPAPATVTSIDISGSLSKTTYKTTDESWNVSGLTVTATYSDSSTADVTSSVEWSFNPETPALMGETQSGTLEITASYEELTDSLQASVIVNAPVAIDANGTYTMVTDESSLQDGDIVIITNNNGTKALSTTQTQNNRSDTDTGIANSEITIDGETSIQAFALQESTTSGSKDAYAFYTGEGYIYAASSSSNYLRTEEELDDNGMFSIAINSSTGVATIVAQGTNTRNTLQHNSNNNLFACYASASQGAVSLFRKNTGPDDPTKVKSVELDKDSASANIGETVTLTATILPNTATTQTATWLTSDSNVATVSNGVVSGVAAGTVTITAFADENGNGILDLGEKSDTCLITIIDPSSAVYDLYTSSLIEGDYIIYYSGKAMNDTISSDRAQYESLEPVNNQISTSNTDVVWHIAPSGDYWTIYSASEEMYLAGTGAKNKIQLLEDGTDDKALWTVTFANSAFEFVNKANSAASVNANLRNNSTYGFACYATSTGGALSLYKKASSPTPSGASEYADLFLDLLSTGTDAVCDDQGNTDLAALVVAWGTLADEYDDLSAEDKATLAGGTASESGDNIARALALYDYIGKKYNTRLQTETLTDYNFMSRSSASASNSINPINQVNNTVAIVVVVTISLVSVSALGAYFLLRKKKEER